MSSKFSEKWGTECLNTRLSVPTLLHAGYSEKNTFIAHKNTPSGTSVIKFRPINYESI